MEAVLTDPPEFPAHALRFGECIDGQSPIIVTYDMFGFQPFYYEQAQGKYRADHDDVLWHTSLSDCSNSEAFNNIAFPKNCSAQQLRESGLNNLGYIATVAAHPELAEYADNPGLLVLLIAHLPRAKPLLARCADRITLVSALSGSDLIRNFHINWLKKVRPGMERPAIAAAKIEASLLRVAACDLAVNENHCEAKRYKLFAHQRHWTMRGLDFARALLQREDIEIDDLSYLMQSFNGNEPTVLAEVRAALLSFGDHHCYLARLARLRARHLARHDQMLSLRFAQTFRHCVRKKSQEPVSPGDFVDLCALFLSDNDVPPPLVKGNRHVRPLDTLKKLRSHAKRARNCVWSMDIINSVLLRQIDVYAVEGENSYTISVDRQTLEISSIQPFQGEMIKPSDLSLIGAWFEEATVLPR